ncbi:MAG: HigA family addiction module antitoxin [Pseudomonadota bacterium]
MSNSLIPLSPGAVLNELYLTPLGMSAGALARKLHVPRTRIERIVKGQTALTPDTALRLAKFFNTTAEYWLNMQSAYDLHEQAPRLAGELAAIDSFEAA